MSQAEIKMFKKKVNIKNEHNDTSERKTTYNDLIAHPICQYSTAKCSFIQTISILSANMIER